MSLNYPKRALLIIMLSTGLFSISSCELNLAPNDLMSGAFSLETSIDGSGRSVIGLDNGDFVVAGVHNSIRNLNGLFIYYKHSNRSFIYGLPLAFNQLEKDSINVWSDQIFKVVARGNQIRLIGSYIDQNGNKSNGVVVQLDTDFPSSDFNKVTFSKFYELDTSLISISKSGIGINATNGIEKSDKLLITGVGQNVELGTNSIVIEEVSFSNITSTPLNAVNQIYNTSLLGYSNLEPNDILIENSELSQITIVGTAYNNESDQKGYLLRLNRQGEVLSEQEFCPSEDNPCSLESLTELNDKFYVIGNNLEFGEKISSFLISIPKSGKFEVTEHSLPKLQKTVVNSIKSFNSQLYMAGKIFNEGSPCIVRVGIFGPILHESIKPLNFQGQLFDLDIMKDGPSIIATGCKNCQGLNDGEVLIIRENI